MVVCASLQSVKSLFILEALAAIYNPQYCFYLSEILLQVCCRDKWKHAAAHALFSAAVISLQDFPQYGLSRHSRGAVRRKTFVLYFLLAAWQVCRGQLVGASRLCFGVTGSYLTCDKCWSALPPPLPSFTPSLHSLWQTVVRGDSLRLWQASVGVWPSNVWSDQCVCFVSAWLQAQLLVLKLQCM